MKMKCRECGREMDLWEFATYAEAYLLKSAIESGIAAFFIVAMKHYFLTQTKGFIDSHMAGLANNFAIQCPKCKKADVWDPAPGKENIVISKNDESNVTL